MDTPLVAGARNENASLRRSWMWLLGFVIFHLVAISRQVDVDGISLFERTLLSFFSPVLNAISSGANGIVGAWSSFVDLREVGTENETLKSRLRSAEMQLLSQRAAVE